MPFQVQVDAAILRITFSGDVTKAEFIEFARELYRVERGFERIPDRLTDLLGVRKLEPDFPTVFDVTQERRAQVFPNKFRSAIVAPTPMTFGIARMFQTLNKSPQIEIRVFETRVEAESWLAANTE